MKIIHKIGIITGIILIITLANGIAQGENLRDVNEFIKKVEAAYENITSFSASFTLKQKDEARTEGKIWYKEGKYKMEAATSLAQEKKTVEQTIIFDGDTAWQYVPEKNMAIKLRLSALSEKIREKIPLNWQKKTLEPLFDREFKMSKRWIEGEEIYILESIPSSGEKNSPYKKIFWVRAKDYLMRKREFYDKGGNLLLSQEFKDIQTNKNIPEDEFIFQAPQGVKIIDMTEKIK